MTANDTINPLTYPTIDVVRQRRLFMKCHVAGLYFYMKEEDPRFNLLHCGAKLALVRQKDNPHDPNAVAVAMSGDFDGDPDKFDFRKIIGYLPSAVNSQLALLLDQGWGSIFTTEVAEVRRTGLSHEKLQINVYLLARVDETSSKSGDIPEAASLTDIVGGQTHNPQGFLNTLINRLRRFFAK